MQKESGHWICPACHRPFKHRNQAHSCVRLTPDVHIDGKLPAVRLIYDKLFAAVKRLGTVRISTTKSTIMFVAASTFLAVKPKKEWIDIEFLLDTEVREYPIHKTIRANKSRVAHFVRLERPRDIDRRLMGWLRRSFLVAGGQPQRQTADSGM